MASSRYQRAAQRQAIKYFESSESSEEEEDKEVAKDKSKAEESNGE